MQIRKIVLTMFLLLFAVPLMAQTQRTNTTFSSAVGAGNVGQVTIASSTSVVTRTGSLINTYFIVDQEVMEIRDLINGPSCSTTCTYTVTRGVRGTAQAPHESGSIVWVVAPNQVYDALAYGSCTASAQAFPRISISANTRPYTVWYQACQANLIGPTAGVGTWSIESTLDNAIPLVQVCDIPIGSVAFGSLGSSITLTAGSSQVSDIFVPYTQQFTGLSVLVGTPGVTDKWIVALWDSLGNLLTNSATAGTQVGAAGTFQQFPFTAKYILTGPARYFVGIQSNGTTSQVKTVAPLSFPDKLTAKAAGVTFGTLLGITPPTTDAGSAGPISCLY